MSHILTTFLTMHSIRARYFIHPTIRPLTSHCTSHSSLHAGQASSSSSPSRRMSHALPSPISRGSVKAHVTSAVTGCMLVEGVAHVCSMRTVSIRLGLATA
ncbi:hypothetical protein BKA63DRAFT_512928 [Paraphoma chrysanthemicola]|nr:hypothetical protein BKA63DRAFT_512928 [Paraphoma chrysanthemicola]